MEIKFNNKLRLEIKKENINYRNVKIKFKKVYVVNYLQFIVFFDSIFNFFRMLYNIIQIY